MGNFRRFGTGLAGTSLALLVVVAALSLPSRLAAEGNDGTAAAEGDTSGLSTTTPTPDGATGDPLQPRDPNVGPVTHFPLPRFVSLKGSEGNARRGPGLTHRIDWVFTHAGMPLKLTAEFEHWRRVEDQDGQGGWVHYSLLSGVRTVIVTHDLTEFHAKPDASSEVLYQAELNVIGKLLQCTLDWCRVSVEGEKAWAPKSDLWGVDADEIFN